MNRLVVLIDIDDTLYCDKEHGEIAHQMRVALIEYVGKCLQLPPLEAKTYVEHCFKTYGLTIAGLVREQKCSDIDAVTEYVYSRCDFSQIPEDPALREMLLRLRQNHHLYYLTNAPRKHAMTVLQRLGLRNEEFSMLGFTYEDQWSYTAPMICNKPMRQAYTAVMDITRKELQDVEWLTDECVVMVDDSARNLLEPLALGWNAVWVSHGNPIPDLLLEHMDTGRLFCMEDIRELEDIIGKITLKNDP